ncbi:MAG: carbohydrate porin, partial [Gammaproteobacteria bacterium]
MTTMKAKLSTALTVLVVAGATPAAEPSYGGDLMTRSTLTGDWGGWRDDLSKKGVTLDVDLVQAGQGVAAGGRDSAWEYNGEALYDFNVDFGKLGLWPGGFLKIFA